MSASAPMFIQIAAAAKTQLYALDEQGGVWRYCPATKKKGQPGGRYAFWSKLTSHRSDPAKP